MSFTCEHCNYTTKLKSSFNTHLGTKKHQNNTKDLPQVAVKRSASKHKSAKAVKTVAKDKEPKPKRKYTKKTNAEDSAEEPAAKPKRKYTKKAKGSDVLSSDAQPVEQSQVQVQSSEEEDENIIYLDTLDLDSSTITDIHELRRVVEKQKRQLAKLVAYFNSEVGHRDDMIEKLNNTVGYYHLILQMYNRYRSTDFDYDEDTGMLANMSKKVVRPSDDRPKKRTKKVSK